MSKTHIARHSRITPPRQPTRMTRTGAATLVLLFATAQGDSTGSVLAGPVMATTKAPARAPITITPAAGASAARPEQGISLTSTTGTLGTIQVSANGSAIQGETNTNGTRWQSRWPLSPGRSYQVTATSTASTGKVTTITSTFTTAAAQNTVAASASILNDGDTVGVGMPIIINFSRPVSNRAQTERALEVRTSTPVERAWHWAGRQQVIFRPKTYWPAGTKVRMIAHLRGARTAKGVYATKNLTLSFTIGDAVISTVDTKKHTMTVGRNGTVLRTFPISAGRATEPRFTTTDGIHVVSEKLSPVIFDSATVGIPKGAPGYYYIKGYWAVRISDTGEFVHSAPWSVADQGKRNVSHGCVNTDPADAQWFFKLSHPGDIVTVTGTSRKLEWDNGLGYWQRPWNTWVAGSALHRSLTTSPLTATNR